MKNVGIVLLAAGNSSRMGKIKQLLPWEHTTLVEHSIKQAESSQAKQVVVVLGAHSDLIRDGLHPVRAILIENEKWKKGLGTSISCGVSYFNTMQRMDGLLILLADQPLIDTLYIDAMLQNFETSEKGIIATQYKNRVGVPALFSATYFSELTNLADDFGAQYIMGRYKNDIFEMPARGKTADVDTMDDYLRLKDTNQ